MGVESWCDFGANLVQHFIGRYSRCSRNRTKTHDKSTISHDISRYSRYQTALPKLEEIKKWKTHPLVCFLFLLRGAKRRALQGKGSPKKIYVVKIFWGEEE